MDAGTILVVDDELESLRLLTTVLQSAGYSVRPADSGELALRSAKEKTPDLIVLDIRMPGLGGLEVCRQLKADPSIRDIPLMFLSASYEAHERIQGLQLGAVDFISKPFQAEELLARVHTQLELGRLRVHLEKLVAERTAELLTSNRQLERELAERELAERALRETEARFRTMADTAPVLIWVSGPDKLCTFFNKGWLDFSGRRLEEELGDGWARGVHPDDRDRCYQIYASSFDARRRFQMEYRLRRADGEYRWVLDTGVPRFEPGGAFSGYIGSCLDITDLKLNQERMLASQKLESLGMLAAGIAHDFNNMLGSIFAQADLAIADLSPNSPARQNLDHICAVAMRASEALNLLMAYAGGEGDETGFEPVDLASLVQETLELLKISITKKATLQTHFAEDCPLIVANSTQLRRVLLNLVTNASEALGHKEGFIRVSTGLTRVRAGTVWEGTGELPEGDYVVLEVSDNGCGMSPPALARIFDPFYSTKAGGRGLGLSAVQGIVRSHHGAIQVRSAPGQGTTFQIRLPCAHAAEPKKSAGPPAVHETSHEGHTILMVEDEETLRLAVSMALAKRGFSVLTAADGHAAMALFRERAHQIDAVLLDLTLPGMSGAELFHEFRRIRHDTKIVLTSAYDRDRVVATLGRAESPDCAFIRKPYRITALVNVLLAIVRQPTMERARIHTR
ncbi:MAG: response regulator [Acidobacteriaceae bacterium]|nr:response regulator [Acidobacteriaceae bacterium]